VLRTGASAPVGVDPGTNEAFCNPGVSDSNPDSNADCVWVFPNTNKANPDTPADWDHVTFTVSVGEFGLGGPNTISTFRIGVEADGELGCPGDSNTFERTDNDIVYVGTRLDNVTADGAPPPTCQAVPYTASNTCPTGSTATQCTNFVYDPLDQGTHMAFYFKWIWGPEPMPTPPPGGTIANSVPPTLQFFLNGNATGIALDFCPGIEPLFDDNGTPEDPTDDIFLGLASPIPPSLDQDPSVPGTQAGCLITRQVIQDGTLIQLIEGAYVQGDYAARRF
jgi:hypothetical protein